MTDLQMTLTYVIDTLALLDRFFHIWIGKNPVRIQKKKSSLAMPD